MITLYKLTELAELEWVHYMTAVNRKNTGKYAQFYIKQGKRDSVRYMSMEDTKKYTPSLFKFNPEIAL